MSDKTFDDLMRQMPELQELYPKVAQDAIAYRTFRT